MRIRTAVLLTVFGLSATAWGALRIADYNTCGAARSQIGTVLEALGTESRNGIARPIDILLLQEQDSTSTTTQQIANVLNDIYGANTYSRSTLNGGTTGAGRPALVYRTDTVALLDETVVNYPDGDGAARSTMRYTIRPVGYDSPAAVFYIYNCHLKASQDGANRRGAEAGQIRANADGLGEGTPILLGGDLNLYSAGEAAWNVFTAPGSGQLFDPINRSGYWHDNYAFKDIHTQSPVTSEYFAGQITGGIDDRFDFLLISGELDDAEGLSYIPGSYFTLGNKDVHAMGGEIVSGGVIAPSLIEALKRTSDHLPVAADFQLPARMQVTVEPIPSELIYNAPVSLAITVRNTAPGALPQEADELDYEIAVSGGLTGSASGTAYAGEEGNTHYLALDTSTPGLMRGQITVTTSSQSAEPADYTQPVEYTVLQSYTRQTCEYGWEDFFSPLDPQASLGTDPEAECRAVDTDSDEGLRSLEVSTPGGGEGDACLAVVYNLLPGDLVEASCRARQKTADSGSICLEGDYLADERDLASTIGSAGAASDPAGPNWTTLSAEWTFDENGGANQAILIKARLSDLVGGGLVDALSITVPAHASVLLPEPTEVTCPALPEKDLNGDCVVDMTDLAAFSQHWLDGKAGMATIPETVLITGVLDGSLGIGYPKAIELYVSGTQDLSAYRLSRALSGNTWDEGVPLQGVYSDTFVYLVCSYSDGVAQFNDVFGTDGVFGNHALEGGEVYLDGNDGFRLVKNGTVVDQVYYPSSAFAYRDTYLYRKDATGPDGGQWVENHWFSPGMDYLDSYTTAGALRAEVPFGTYKPASGCTDYPQLDYSNNCRVDLADIVLFLDDWMQCNLAPNWACGAH